MNFLLAVVTTVLVVSVCELSANPILSHDKKVLLYKHHQDCQTKTGVDKHIFYHAEDAIKAEDPKFKEYLLCFMKKLDYINEKGELHREAIKKKLEGIHEKDSNVDVVVKECVVVKEQPLESAFGFYKCYNKYYPTQGFLFQVIRISEDVHKKIRAQYTHCSKESGVAKEILDRACKGDFAEDALLKKFSHCFIKRLGFQNEEGKILESVVREKLREMVLDEDQSNILVEKCLRERDTPEQTAFEFMRCFLQNSHIDVSRDPFSSEDKKLLVETHAKCRKESPLEDALIEKFKLGDNLDHPQAKKHLYCVYKKTGLIDELGEFNREKIQQKLAPHYTESSQIEKEMKKCLIKKASPEETSYYVHNCFYENIPHKYNIFSVL